MSAADDVWHTHTCSAADIARELDIHWVVHRILRINRITEHWVPNNATDDDKVHCMGLCEPFLYHLDMLH